MDTRPADDHTAVQVNIGPPHVDPSHHVRLLLRALRREEDKSDD
jgi:hypothetical protein